MKKKTNLAETKCHLMYSSMFYWCDTEKWVLVGFVFQWNSKHSKCTTENCNTILKPPLQLTKIDLSNKG